MRNNYYGLEPVPEKKKKDREKISVTLKRALNGAAAGVKSAAVKTASSARRAGHESAEHRRAKRKMRLETAVSDPAENMSPVMSIVGIVLRTFTVFMGIFSLLIFLCDAMNIVHFARHYGVFYVEPGFVALCSAVAAILAVAARYNKITAAAVPVLSLGGAAGVIAAGFGNPALFLWETIRRLVNYCVGEMAAIGFTSVSDLRIGSDRYSYNPNVLLNASVALLAALLGVFFAFTIARKMHVIPNAVLITAFYVFVFSYNITQTNTGFALTLVFICGAIALAVYDYRFMGGIEKRAAAKKARAEKRAAKKRVKEAHRREKTDLRRRAAAVYNAALEAQAGPKKAAEAKKAVFARYEAAKKKQKAALKAENKQRRIAEKAARKAASAELKKKKQNYTDAEKAEAKRIAAAEKAEKKAARRAESKTRRIREFRRRATGGFAAAVAMAVAGVSVWLPAAALKTAFPVIKPLDEPISYMRRYVTTLLRGDDVDLNGTLYSGDYPLSHTLSFDDIIPTGNRVFHVDAGDSRSVYLRSWLGTSFDNSTSTWLSFTPSQVVAMKDQFGGDFSSDDITTSFMRYVYPGAAAGVKNHEKKTFSKYGFIFEQVGVIRKSGASRVLFMPSFSDRQFGVLRYASLERTLYPYSSYFDGVYSTRFFDVDEGYSTLSYVPVMNDPGVGDAVDQSIRYFEYTMEAVRAVESGEDPTAAEKSLNARLAAEQIGYTGESLFSRYMSMSAAEKRELLAFDELAQKYAGYVQATYTAPSGSDRISSLAEEIEKSAAADDGFGSSTTDDTKITLHERVMKVINYLGSGDYKYTLTPVGGDDPIVYDGLTDAAEKRTESGIAEKFLFETKEGYCSHFATSAVLLLREMGISARYVEGYIANSFERDFTARSSGYSTSVTDENAHAWVEVYFPERGWITYEATPPYMDDMYKPSESSPGGYQPDPYVPGSKEDPPVNDEPYEFVEDENIIPSYVFWIIGGVLIAAAVATVAILIRMYLKKSENIVYQRHVILTNAMSKEAYLAGEVPEGAGRMINDWIFGVFAVAGFTPKKGELPADFAHRVDVTLGRFSRYSCTEIMEYVGAEEFGHGLSQGALAALAEYELDLLTVVYGSMNIFKKIYFRYIRRVL